MSTECEDVHDHYKDTAIEFFKAFLKRNMFVDSFKSKGKIYKPLFSTAGTLIDVMISNEDVESPALEIDISHKDLLGDDSLNAIQSYYVENNLYLLI